MLKKITKFLVGRFEHPLPSPYIVYFFALCAFVLAFYFSAELVRLASSKGELVQAYKTLEADKVDFSTKAEQLARLREQERELKGRVEELERTRRERQSVLDVLEDQVTEQQEINQQLTISHTDLRRENRQLTDDNNQMRQAREASKTELSDLKIEVSRLERERNGLQQELDELKKLAPQVRQELEQLKGKRAELEGEVGSMRISQKVLSELETMKRQNEKVISELASSVDIVSQSSRKISTLPQQLDELTKNNGEFLMLVREMGATKDDLLAVSKLRAGIESDTSAIARFVAELPKASDGVLEVSRQAQRLTQAADELRDVKQSTDNLTQQLPQKLEATVVTTTRDSQKQFIKKLEETATNQNIRGEQRQELTVKKVEGIIAQLNGLQEKVLRELDRADKRHQDETKRLLDEISLLRKQQENNARSRTTGASPKNDSNSTDELSTKEDQDVQ